jgi:hypothetical protein
VPSEEFGEGCRVSVADRVTDARDRVVGFFQQHFGPADPGSLEVFQRGLLRFAGEAA